MMVGQCKASVQEAERATKTVSEYVKGKEQREQELFVKVSSSALVGHV